MATFQWPFFCNDNFFNVSFLKSIFQQICCNVSISNGSISNESISNGSISNGSTPNGYIPTSPDFIFIYACTLTWFIHQLIRFLLLLYSVVPSPPEMSRLSCLDSSSSSDDDEPELILSALHQAHTQYLALNNPRWGGSIPGRNYIHRERESGHFRLYNDYFSEHPTYGESIFRRRFANILVNSFALFSHALSMCKFFYSHFFAQV